MSVRRTGMSASPVPRPGTHRLRVFVLCRLYLPEHISNWNRKRMILVDFFVEELKYIARVSFFLGFEQLLLKHKTVGGFKVCYVEGWSSIYCWDD
mmetsp:Transcript_9772/g.11265  ORF Transcript_9772/g.11265 Transcript_9772/m.11265 type:complete len:95 (-) Transcript_9772:66-350(-)